MTILIRVLAAAAALTLIAAPVDAKPRAGKAQSDVSSKYNQTLDGIAQNMRG